MACSCMLSAVSVRTNALLPADRRGQLGALDAVVWAAKVGVDDADGGLVALAPNETLGRRRHRKSSAQNKGSTHELAMLADVAARGRDVDCGAEEGR